MFKGKLFDLMLQEYIKEFLGAGELWYNYFWKDEKERLDDKQSVNDEFEGMFLDIIAEAKASLFFKTTQIKQRFEDWVTALPNAERAIIRNYVIEAIEEFEKEVSMWFGERKEE